MKVRPLGDNIIVKPVEDTKVTAGGIIIPDTIAEKEKSEGVIVAVGEGERIKQLGLKVGDKVMFGKYSGEEFKEDKQQYRILSVAKAEDKSDVFAVFNE